MAFSNALAKYIGNELVSAGTKGLAKAGATSALSSLIPEVATKAATSLATNAGTDMATKALSLGLSRSPEGNWLMDTSSWNAGGTKDLKDFVRPMLGGEETPNYQRFLEQIGEGNYRGSLNGHTPGWFDDDGNVIPSTLDNIEGNGDILPKIYGDNREATLRGLLSLGNRGDEAMKSASVIANYRGKPNELATIYRQSPKDINYGDWVGLTDSYANLHEGNSEMNKLWSKQVPANEVFFAGDDINEWYYMPKEVKLDAELGKALDNAMGYAKQNASLYTPAGIEKANIVNGRLSDANGNPMRVYHSTPNEFSEFDDSLLGDNTYASNTAYGHFTTPDKEFSSRFRDINNEGKTGRTMELQVKSQKPITHPYDAGLKYGDAESDQIVRNYFKAVGAEESLAELEADAAEDGLSLYEEYMSRTLGEDPFEAAKWEREDLMKNGYDAMEIIEGPRNKIVDGAKETAPVSSIVAFEGKNLRPTTHLPISAIESEGADIPVNKAVMDRVAKYLEAPTDAKLPAGYSNLISKAKNYKSLDRFEKMNNPIKGSEIWGEKPKSYFERDSRAVRINMFPNEAVKGSGITKQYLLNLLKDAYDQGITDIVPSYGSYTKEGASFMNHLAEQGWVKANGKNGWNSYEIAPKIAEWEKTSPLADIYNEAHNVAKGKNFRPTDANADGVIDWNDVKSIYAQAEKQQKVLDKMARSISEKEGYPEYQDFSPKSIESMENKVARKGGDYSLASMKDHTRNKIMMNSWNDVGKTINDIAEVFGGTPAVEYVVNDWGYKGLHITGRFDNGLGWEIQLTTPEDWPRKLRSDAIYDKWRNVQLDNASPKEIMGYMNAMRESKAMWSESRIPDLSMFDNTRG